MATDFTRRFRTDPFFRTEATLIFLQTLFAVSIVILVAIGFRVLYDELITNLVAGILDSVRMTNTVTASSAITDNLEYLRSKHLVIVGALIIVVTLIFSYLISQLALAPTRNALASQKQFIGNVAHEIRTPLSIIKTNAEVALFSPSLSKDMREIFESTIEELDRASNIINNLLSVSALTKREQIPFQNVSLAATVETVLAHVKNLAEKKGIVIAYTSSGDSTVWGNASALEQIVMNVVKNALHYTKAGSISVTVQRDIGDFVELQVEDTGIGIKEEDLQRIFEPFYRGDQSRTRGEAGSGLGLTIVNELLHLHEGRINIKSAPGHGTKVSIAFPPGHSRERYEEINLDFSHA